MAHRDKVVRSIENPDGTRCVDLVRLPDGAYGFAEYRRDPEDGRGWSPAGAPPGTGFATEAEALGEARRSVPWLDMVLEPGR
ncbi:MAG TPA: hypothetical protein VLA52_16445 [Thermohalobaculum sp.]|nr:hypothetical protein [Thermohalobaculum sp.]